MVSGGLSLLFLLIGVLLIIYLTSKVKLNAFLALLIVAFLYGLAIRMPLPDIVGRIKNGFGGTLGSIGIVIIAGTIIGIILEKTGAAFSMTQVILKIVGNKRAPLAMSLTGYVVSIPVFCDSGYVILTPLNKALGAKSKTSMAVMAVALGTGLHATHALVPPTPGPIAAAGNLGADLGAVIGIGAIAAIVSMLAGYIWALKVASRYDIESDVSESYEDIVAKYKTLPGACHSFMPLVVPILLILLNSVANFPTSPFGEGSLKTVMNFIGNPITALVIGVLIALTLVRKEQRSEAVSSWMNDGIKSAALILAITGAGGAFGNILKGSPMADFIQDTLGGMQLGMFLPFLIAMALKTAQGSGTVALITTSALMAPLVPVLGLNPVLVTLAIGSGAVICSHANDSYFWVVSQFSGMKPALAYKLWTTSTAVQGVASFIFVLLLSLFI